MEFKDLIALYFERSNAMAGVWGFYISVVLGLLAYFGTTKQSRQKTVLAIIVSLGFLGFAWVNGTALLEVTRERQAAYTSIMSYLPTEAQKAEAQEKTINDIRNSIHLEDAAGLKYFLFASDGAVLLGLWALTIYGETKLD